MAVGKCSICMTDLKHKGRMSCMYASQVVDLRSGGCMSQRCDTTLMPEAKSAKKFRMPLKWCSNIKPYI